MESPQRSLIKRPRTHETPIRPHKRRSLRELAKENLLLPRWKLLSSPPNTELSEGAGNWGHEEVKALVVMFILFHCKDDSWPAHRMDMWNEVGKFIKMKSGSPHQRSGGASHCIRYQINLSCRIFNVAVGNACRFKVFGWLKRC